MNVLDILRQRGFVQQVSDEPRLRAALGRPVSVYCGYDPTRDSLTVGHLMSIMMLSHFQRAGHRPIALLGAGTTMIGDPTGKTEMREMLSREEIGRNARAVRRQFERFIDFDGDRALLLNNADWLLQLGYVEFLRDIGRHFSVNQLLQHETYRERLAGDGLNFIELNYALLQAYDFLHLFGEQSCVLQIGGSDQWFNILAGVELIRRVRSGDAFGLVSPLLMTSSGVKMGKTEAGAVWLDATRTSPYDFYQFWVRTEDADVGRFLRLFTFLPLEEVAELEALSGADLNRAKERLAHEVTLMVHGAEAADHARAASRAAFGGAREAAALEHVPATSVDRPELAVGFPLVDALVRAGLAASRGDAKRQIQGGGVYVNDQRADRLDQALALEDLRDGQILLRRGKKLYHRLVVSDLTPGGGDGAS